MQDVICFTPAQCRKFQNLSEKNAYIAKFYVRNRKYRRLYSLLRDNFLIFLHQFNQIITPFDLFQKTWSKLFFLTNAVKFYPSPIFVTNCTSGLKGLLLWLFLKPVSIWCKYLRPPRQTNGHSDKNETFRQEGQPVSNELPTFEFNVKWFIIDISKSQWMFSWKFHNCTLLTWANSTNQASWPSWRTCLAGWLDDAQEYCHASNISSNLKSNHFSLSN